MTLGHIPEGVYPQKQSSENLKSCNAVFVVTGCHCVKCEGTLRSVLGMTYRWCSLLWSALLHFHNHWFRVIHKQMGKAWEKGGSPQKFVIFHIIFILFKLAGDL